MDIFKFNLRQIEVLSPNFDLALGVIFIITIMVTAGIFYSFLRSSHHELRAALVNFIFQAAFWTVALLFVIITNRQCVFITVCDEGSFRLGMLLMFLFPIVSTTGVALINDYIINRTFRFGDHIMLSLLTFSYACIYLILVHYAAITF